MTVSVYNYIRPKMLEIYKFFPSTPLPLPHEERIFIKLPRALGYDEDVYAVMHTAIEGMKLSNHISDQYMKTGLLAYGFETCSNDDSPRSYASDRMMGISS
jgi:hypothetical protein